LKRMRPHDDRPWPEPEGSDANQTELDEALAEIGFEIQPKKLRRGWVYPWIPRAHW
jgi:hypothetical protein